MTQPTESAKSNERLEKSIEDLANELAYSVAEEVVADTQCESEIFDHLMDFAAQVEEREREQCCKDVCPECAKGDKAVRSPYADEADRSTHSAWIHTMLGFDDRTEDCRASAIRERSVTRG